MKLFAAFINHGDKKIGVHQELMTALIPEMCEAIRNGANDLVLSLLKMGVDPDAINQEGNTLSFIAAYSGNQRALGHLSDFGADLSVTVPGGVSILQTAARNSSLLRHVLALDPSLDVNHQDNSGMTPLMSAVNIAIPFAFKIDHSLARDRLTCIDLLISKGANLDTANMYGRTALMNACYTQNIDLITSLLKLGANATLRCKADMTAFTYINNKEIESEVRRYLFR